MDNARIIQVIAELASCTGPGPNPQDIGPCVGDAVIVRTVTHYYTGRIEAMNDRWIRLADAAWIADTGRWAQALANGTLNEIEPYPNGCWVAVGAVVDMAPWDHDLPRTSK